MKLYRSRTPQPADTEARSGAYLGPYPWGVGPNTMAGAEVTPENALRAAAVAACVRVLTTTVAYLPVNAVRYVGGRHRPVEPTPAIVARPSEIVRRRAFVAQVMRSMLTRGNAYAQVTAYDRLGRALALETIAPRRVSWAHVDGRLRPRIDSKPVDLYPLGPLVHVPASAFIPPGTPVADSPVELAREAIGTGLAAEEFGARYFGDGGHPRAVFRSKETLSEEQARTIKDRVRASWVGREPAVVGSGLEVEFPKVDVTDGQFIELLRFEVEQACRYFGVPPTMVYAAVSGSSVTYSNVTDSDLQYLKHSVGIWLADVEDAWSELLPAGQVVRFNVDALLRLDAKARHELYGSRLSNRTMTVNEVRRLEDEAPFPGPEFDRPGIPTAAAPTPAAPPEE